MKNKKTDNLKTDFEFNCPKCKTKIKIKTFKLSWKGRLMARWLKLKMFFGGEKKLKESLKKYK